jgi:GNAT superfamily N-acetyltransferase
MIHTTINREDALKILDLGKEIHAETRFSHTEYSKEAFWKLLNLCSLYPTRYKCIYSKNDLGEITAFFLGLITEEYFSGKLIAYDLGMFVKKEFRGSSQFIRMLKEFELWAKENGAYKAVLYHSTGIDPDKALTMFPKLGYEHYGYIFDKEF